MNFDEMALLARFLRLSGLGRALCSRKHDEDDEEITPMNRHRFRQRQLEEPDELEILKYPGSQIDKFHQLRRQVQGIGTRDWLENIAEELGMQDLEMTAYTFFAYVLDELRIAQAGELHDKIYAAYGFLKKALEPLNITPRFRPDYTKDVETVYQEIAEIHFKTTPEFRTLCFKEPPSMTNLTSLPSWCPDFSVRSHISLAGTDHYSRYNASKVSRPRAAPSESLYSIHGSTLTLNETFVIGRITDILAPPQEVEDEDEMTLSILKLIALHTTWLELLIALADATGKELEEGSGNRWDVFIDTLLAGHVSGQMAWKPVPHAHFKAYMAMFLGYFGAYIEYLAFEGDQEDREQAKVCLDLRRVFFDDAKVFPDLLPSEVEVNELRVLRSKSAPDEQDQERLMEENRKIDSFTEAMERHLLGRNMFVTDGASMGLSSRDVKVGDEVVLVRGARMVFVVRRREDGEGYTLVGEAYVSGAMDGEFVGKAESEGWRKMVLV
jgi:hypothetical protein